MTWDIEGTDEFDQWLDGLDDAERARVIAAVDYLELKGPSLGAPHTSGIHSSRHPRMRELRIQHLGRPLRVLYAFDPRRTAILLLGGDRRAMTGGTSAACRWPMISTTRTWLSSGARG